MLSFKLLSAVFLAGFAVAQNTTSSSGSDSSSDSTVFDVNDVNLSQRVAWCNQQFTNCPKLCGGPNFLGTNRCEAQTNTVDCTCTNGTAPALAAYADTYASNECQARFAACREQNPGSQSCIECGNLRADDVPASTSSASTAAATSSTGSTESAAPATTSEAPSSGGNVLLGAEMGVKGAVGLLAAMGLML